MKQSEMVEKRHPRLVMIVTDGPVMAGAPSVLGGRTAIHTSVASPPLPPAAIAVSVATGVSPMLHGILTRGTVDSKTYQIREAERSDRRAQAFWDDTDLVVKTINWPAVEGDERVTNTQSSDEFNELYSCLDADIVGVVLPRSARKSSSKELVVETQIQLEQIISKLDIQTSVIIVHRRAHDDATLLESIRPYASTFLVDDNESQIQKIPYLELVGGAAHLLAGVGCPAGVKQPTWSFLESYVLDEPRSFPQIPSTEDTDWSDVIAHVVSNKYEPGITLLTQRFVSLISTAFKKESWEEMEYSGASLIELRGSPFDYWMLVLALDQQGKLEALQSIVEQLEKTYPQKMITTIAKGLIQLDHDKSVEQLQEIEFSKIGIYHAIGAYGRLCLKSGLPKQGEASLLHAIRQGVATSADRAQLANYYHEQKSNEEALRVLRTVGLQRGELSWQVLRLKILVALGLEVEVIQQANQVLSQDSTHSTALSALEKFSS